MAVRHPGESRGMSGLGDLDPPVTGEGATRLALCPEGGAQIDERVDVIRVERQSVQVGDDGLVELSLRSQRIAEIVVGGRIRGIARGRPRYQLGGPSMFAALMEDHAQEMQRIDVLRIDPQHFSVGRPFLRPTPSMMSFPGRPQLPWNVT